MTRTGILASILLLACKPDGDTTSAPDGGGGASTGGDAWDSKQPAGDVPAAVDELPPVPEAMPLGSEMWRRFGKGEWTAHSFFVPDVATHSATIIVDMEGGGKAVSDPFELVIEPQGAELRGGEARIDGRVPPGLERRATWTITAAQPGIVKIRFTTVKGGEEKGGTVACLKFADDAIFRCTQSEANDPAPPDTTARGTYCCETSKNGAGEGCRPIGNVVGEIEQCMKAKQHTLTCDAGVSCTGTTCRCR